MFRTVRLKFATDSSDVTLYVTAGITGALAVNQ